MGSIDRTYRKALVRAGINVLEAKAAYYPNIDKLVSDVVSGNFDAIREQIMEHGAFMDKAKKEEEEAEVDND